MDLARIFVDEDSMEGLFSIIYDNESEAEFDRIFDNWYNDEYLLNYLVTNKNYIDQSIYKHYLIDQLFQQIRDETEAMENWLYNYSKQEFIQKGSSLQMIFKPYNDLEPLFETQQKSKAKIIRLPIKNPILRVYSIKVSENTFIVTGGAIKFMHKMNQHPDTIEEDNKLKQSMNFLKSLPISCEEDIIYYYEQH